MRTPEQLACVSLLTDTYARTAAHYSRDAECQHLPELGMTRDSSLAGRARQLAVGAYRRIPALFENPQGSKWLPLDSRAVEPPRRWAHTPEFCDRRGLEWHEVIPAGTIRRRPPHCTNYPSTDMLRLVTTELAASGTARLKNARVIGTHGWIVAKETRISRITAGIVTPLMSAPFINPNRLELRSACPA